MPLKNIFHSFRTFHSKIIFFNSFSVRGNCEKIKMIKIYNIHLWLTPKYQKKILNGSYLNIKMSYFKFITLGNWKNSFKTTANSVLQQSGNFILRIFLLIYFSTFIKKKKKRDLTTGRMFWVSFQSSHSFYSKAQLVFARRSGIQSSIRSRFKSVGNSNPQGKGEH